MRDFPMFVTENGVASLTLNQIPYTANAYIKLQDTQSPEQLLKECVDFCTMAGAEHIYASGHIFLEQYPLHTVIVQMRCLLDSIPDTDASIFPVTSDTLTSWLELYNEKMKDIPNAVHISSREGEKILKSGHAYFVHREGTLLGIGIASSGTVEAIASVQPGAGRDVFCALCHALSQETVCVEVAHNNQRAIRLYEQLGFVKIAEIGRWYKIF